MSRTLTAHLSSCDHPAARTHYERCGSAWCMDCGVWLHVSSFPPDDLVATWRGKPLHELTLTEWADLRAHVLFPSSLASADTHPQDGNSTEIEAPLVSGAVAANSSETPNLSAEGDS